MIKFLHLEHRANRFWRIYQLRRPYILLWRTDWHRNHTDDQHFDEDDDTESVSSEVSESDKPVPNSLAALNALETLTANFEAKSNNPDGALKMIYGLYESVHDVNNFLIELFVKTDWKCIFVCVFVFF